MGLSGDICACVFITLPNAQDVYGTGGVSSAYGIVS